MRFKEAKLEETETSHTLSGAGEGRVQGRGKGIGVSMLLCYQIIRYQIHLDSSISPGSTRAGCVVWTETPVWLTILLPRRDYESS